MVSNEYDSCKNLSTGPYQWKISDWWSYGEIDFNKVSRPGEVVVATRQGYSFLG